MPERQTLQRARRDKRQGKAASTQAGEFIREEIHHVREGVHGARSTRQAIAIGLSKARRAGVDLKPPSASRASPETRRSAERDYERGHDAAPSRHNSPKRSQSSLRALRSEGKSAATPSAISRQAQAAAGRRGPGQRSAAARRAATTRARRSGRSGRHAPA
jgi:hypothetical protein